MNQLPAISEAEFTRQVIDLARLHGWRVAHFRSVRVQRKNGSVYYATPVQGDGDGFPDLILRHPSCCRRAAVELKIPPNKPTQAQEQWLADFAICGDETYVWYPKDWPEIEKVLAGDGDSG